MHTVALWFLDDLDQGTHVPPSSYDQLRTPPEGPAASTSCPPSAQTSASGRGSSDATNGDVATVCVGGTLSPRGRQKARKHGHGASSERRGRKKKSASVVRSLSFFFALSPHLTLFATPFTPLHPRTIALRICSRAVVPLDSTTCDLPTLHDPTRERYAKSDVALTPSRPLRLFEPTANPAAFARLTLYLSLRRPNQSFRRTDSGKGETGLLPFVQPIPILRDVRPLAYSPHKRS